MIWPKMCIIWGSKHATRSDGPFFCLKPDNFSTLNLTEYSNFPALLIMHPACCTKPQT